MEENKLSSLKALYKRLLPALKTRKNEIVLSGFPYVTTEDIFNYLKSVKWKNVKEITIHEMVSDVLNTDTYEIAGYLNKTKKSKDLLKNEETLL